MKSYPSIPKDYDHSLQYYVFDKLDGNQIRCEWTRKQGICKFGTRHVLLGEFDTTNKFSPACALIRSLYEDDITRVLRELRVDKAVLFFEYYGPQSFAGNHVEGDEMTVTLFDVDLYKHGLMMPDQFLKYFGDLKVPKLLHHGKVGTAFIETVRDSSLPGITFEGVVCKAKHPKKTPQPIMFKIKTQAWLDRLHNFCGDDAELYRKLE